MCLEFLCSWCHKEEDGPEHHGQIHRTSLPPSSKPPINGTDTRNSDKYLGRHDPPSEPDSGRSSNGTNTWNDDTYPARHDPPSKHHSEPYSGNKNPDEDLKAVHPRPSALARPHEVANNTVGDGADSNLMHTNNHYPTVGDGAQRNGHMRKNKEEEDDDDDDDDDKEEEEVSKAAQTKNRRY